MSLLEKLERKRREFDQRARESLFCGGYDQHAADMRDLLDTTTDQIRMYEWMIRRFVENLEPEHG